MSRPLSINIGAPRIEFHAERNHWGELQRVPHQDTVEVSLLCSLDGDDAKLLRRELGERGFLRAVEVLIGMIGQ